MVETTFEGAYSANSRLAAVHAAAIVAIHELPYEDRRDLEQEALLELWRKRHAYDACRGSWRTFSERVVTNRLRSLMRSRCSKRFGTCREEPFDSLVGLAALTDDPDLRTDISRILARVSPHDRAVALSLGGHSVVETSRLLGISRAATYRSIGRLRLLFISAGLRPATRKHGRGARV